MVFYLVKWQPYATDLTKYKYIWQSVFQITLFFVNVSVHAYQHECTCIECKASHRSDQEPLDITGLHLIAVAAKQSTC